MSEKILAVCAGHEITEKEVKDLIANYPPEQQIYLSSPKAQDELVEQLIGFHLFSKMAEENKIKESSGLIQTQTANASKPLVTALTNSGNICSS